MSHWWACSADQDADRRDALQFAPCLLEVALGRIDVDAEDMRSIAHREALENGEQQDLALQRCHLRKRFLESPADAARLAALLEAAEWLAQTMKQGKDTKFGVLGIGDQLRLPHGNLRAQAHPLVAALLGAGDGAGVTAQKRQGSGNCFGQSPCRRSVGHRNPPPQLLTHRQRVQYALGTH